MLRVRALPNILTLLRILFIPFLLVPFYLPGIEAHTQNVIAVVMFVAAAITDYLDGFLARHLKQVSAFGTFLDPVADKLMICAALVLLLYLQRIDALIALTIIGREIAISAMREWMAKIGSQHLMSVNFLGKLKTFSQMLAIPFLLYSTPLFGINIHLLGQILIHIAAALTIWSMVHYLYQIWRQGGYIFEDADTISMPDAGSIAKKP